MITSFANRARVIILALVAACSTSTRPATSPPPPAKPTTPPRSAVRKPSPDTLWLFASRPGSDAIHKSDSESTLIARFGAANVRRDSIHEGEGMYAAGALLFPNDPLRKIEIVWDNESARSGVDYARLAGKGSRWVAFPGVSLGTCLDDVQKINGAPFTLAGVGWDYGGTSLSWGTGRLGSLWGSDLDKRVILRFDIVAQSPMPRELIGDKDVQSTHPALFPDRTCVRELIVRPR